MPTMNIIRSTAAGLSNGQPLVVVLAGGTTGIGSYVADSLARSFAESGSKLRVYIVGRNASRAEAVMAKGRSMSQGSDWRFIQVTDLALIKEVDHSCAEVIRQETEAPLHDRPSIDLLYLSHGWPILKERTTTIEGLDAFMSMMYYSRIRFITQLMQLLTASSLPAHIISVYAGGFEDGTKAGETPIGCPLPATYGITGVRKHTCFMKNFMFEEFAQRHAGRLSLTHIYPGLVDGPAFYSDDMPRWFRVVWKLMKPLARVYMTSAKDCGDVMVYLASDRFPAKGIAGDKDQKVIGSAEVATSTLGVVGGGSYAVGQRGNVTAKNMMYEKVRRDGLSQKVWDHTMKVLTEVERENEVSKRNAMPSAEGGDLDC